VSFFLKVDISPTRIFLHGCVFFPGVTIYKTNLAHVFERFKGALEYFESEKLRLTTKKRAKKHEKVKIQVFHISQKKIEKVAGKLFCPESS